VATHCYDAAGNMLQDGSSYPPYDTYAWDGEGRLKSIDNGSYAINLVYNALGQQVEQDAPGQFRLVFPYHVGGEKMGWYDVNAGYFTRYQMLVAGREVRFYPTNLRYYYHANHIGSGAMVTDNTGAAFGERMYYPYGQSWSTAGGWVTTEFAAFRDSVLGGDDVYVTPFRHYRVDVYRWLSPDPLAGDVMNPQSLNRYAYVLNNPINFVDPSGQVPRCPQLLTHDVSADGCGPSAGGGGGFGSCSIDGFASDCGLVTGLIISGAAAQCPNNVCFGSAIDNAGNWRQVEYEAFAGAAGAVDGYYATSGPGALYYNASQAGIGSAQWGSWYSREIRGREVGGSIWCGYGICSSTLQGPGNEWSATIDPNFLDIPGGTEGAGWWRSTVGPYSAPGDLSNADSWNQALRTSYDLYTGTTTGQVLLYGPTTGGVECTLAGPVPSGGDYAPRCGHY